MTRHPIKCIVFAIISLFIFISPLSAELVQDDYFNFTLDLPEGFKVDTASEDGMSYVFSHPNIPVTLVLKIYNNPSYKDSSNVLKITLNKLSAMGDIDSFKWSDQKCSVSNFSMDLDKSYKGWGVCAPSTEDNGFITLLCYSPKENFDKCQQFIISTINSLCIDKNYYNTPGVITTYAYPKEGYKRLVLNIDGKKVITSIDKSDVEASKFLVEMEFGVLALYSKMPNWKEAWQRYYRMIYRDSSGRIKKVSEDIYIALYKEAEISNPQNPDIAYAQSLLSWVQNFEYKRATTKTSSDFTSIPAVLCGEGNDCDSRAMLINILLKSIGIDSFILISREYSHAIVVADINAPGQKYTLDSNGKEYIFGETTAKVTWGMIAADQTDRAKWIPVTLPY